jgi:heme exporter protein D
MDLGPHAVFIWVSYMAVVIVVAGMILWLAVDGRRQSTALKDLEARGIRRRSAGSDLES